MSHQAQHGYPGLRQILLLGALAIAVSGCRTDNIVSPLTVKKDVLSLPSDAFVVWISENAIGYVSYTDSLGIAHKDTLAGFNNVKEYAPGQALTYAFVPSDTAITVDAMRDSLIVADSGTIVALASSLLWAGGSPNITLPGDTATLAAAYRNLLSATDKTGAYRALAVAIANYTVQHGDSVGPVFAEQVEAIAIPSDSLLRYAEIIHSLPDSVLAGQVGNDSVPPVAPSRGLKANRLSGQGPVVRHNILAGGRPLSVFFINGIATQISGANTDLDRLNAFLIPTGVLGPNKLAVLSYNPTAMPDSADQLACQISVNHIAVMHIRGPRVVANLKTCLPGAFEGGIGDIAQALAQQINIRATYGLGAQAAATNLANNIEAALDNGNKVIVVAHSQGNMMAMEALAALQQRRPTSGPATAGCIGVVYVATPQLDVPVLQYGGLTENYRVVTAIGTWAKDIITITRNPGTYSDPGFPNQATQDADVKLLPLETAAQTTPLEFARNILQGYADIRATILDVPIHSFVDSYLASPGTRDPIVNGVKDMAATMDSTCPGPVNADIVASSPMYAGIAAAFNGLTSSSTSGSITQYSWDWGDFSSLDTAAATTHAFATPGTYTVTLTVTDALGRVGVQSKAFAVSVAVASPTVTCTPLSLPAGGVATCAASGDSGSVIYAWTGTSRTGPGTGASTTYSLSAAGTASVSATATDGQYNISSPSTPVTLTFTATVPPAPVVTCTPLHPVAGQPSTCSVPAGGTATYNWPQVASYAYHGGVVEQLRTGPATGLSTTYMSTVLTYVSNTNYQSPIVPIFTITASNQYGTSAPSNSIQLLWTNPLPSAPVVSCTPTVPPAGQTITCTASGSTSPAGDPVTSYNWPQVASRAYGSGTVVQNLRTGPATGLSTTYLSTTLTYVSNYNYLGPIVQPFTVTANNLYTQTYSGTTGAASAPVQLRWSSGIPSSPTVSCIPVVPPAGQTITCTASGSISPAGDPVTSYNWPQVASRAYGSGTLVQNLRTGPATGLSTTYMSTSLTYVSNYNYLGPVVQPFTVTANNLYTQAYPENTGAVSAPVQLRWGSGVPTTPTVSCVARTVPAGQTITCTVSGSVSPAGDAVTYHWPLVPSYQYSGTFIANTRTGPDTGTTSTYMSTVPLIGPNSNYRAFTNPLVVTATNGYTDLYGGASPNSNAIQMVWQ